MNNQMLADLEAEIINFITSNLADIISEPKYGGLLFKSGKNDHFCGVFVYKEHLSIEFGEGYRLTDPDGLLHGKGKYRRHLKYAERGEVNWDALLRFLKEGAQLAEAGNANT
ncbi:MAG: DUF1801 domain-containing protein [Calditrichia bacterium]